MEEHEQGREAFESEEAYRLHCLRHSTAHVMAQAIMRLYPEAKLAIGPSITDGFYYDIDIDSTISETDLEKIEAEMKKVCKENQRFEHEVWPVDQALTYFKDHSQKYKVELIEGFGDEEVHIYKNASKSGEIFLDLCRGPHVMRTKQCKHFKLLKVSGAYWRGDSERDQLQRVYGTVWPTRDELDKYLYRLEEAKKRDHRRLGKELGLFMFHPYAPGAPFWLPKGEHIYQVLSRRMRDLLVGEDYISVKTPLIFDKTLWETSGHWEHYQDNMFHFKDGETPVGCDHSHDRSFGLKPMNCPSHMLIFKNSRRSYKELPLRIHDQGVLHRNEISGALSGLTRVRQFAQDDGHIFCTNQQILGEIRTLLALIDRIYSAFDMGYAIKLSTRPDKYMGELDVWNEAEASLRKALDESGKEYAINEGDGAFYGPKIDFEVLDALGRTFQCATIQLDFQLPKNFQLEYVTAENTTATPVVIHRAILGSFERFIGILIEHYAGKFPLWLAPEQARVLTISEKSSAHGEAVTERLKAAGLQVTYDNSPNKIGYKIREARNQRIPYLLVIGEAEQENNTVSVRSRDIGDLGSMSLDELVGHLQTEAIPRL